jgi:hypothetical protein
MCPRGLHRKEGRQAGRQALKGSGLSEVDSSSDPELFVVNGGRQPSTFLENH